MIFLMLVSLRTYGQNPYYESIELSKYGTLSQNKILLDLSDLDSAEIRRIFSKYVPEGSKVSTHINDIIENPFIRIVGTTQSGNELISSGTVASNQSTGKFDGLNITNVADGLAKFLVERTKQELSISFFQKFKSTVDANPDFKRLFPSTVSVLDVIDRDIYLLSNYLITLRASFQDDLDNLLIQLEPYLIEKQKVLSDKEEVANAIDYFLSASLLVNNIQSGVHPAEAISKLSYQPTRPENLAATNLKELVKLFTIFSKSLTSNAEGNYWIESDSLNLMLNRTSFQIYLGLLYQQHGSEVIFGKEFSFYLDKVAAGLNSGGKELANYQNFIRGFINNTDRLQTAILSVQKNETPIAAYSEVLRTSLQLMNNFQEFKTIDQMVNTDGLVEVMEVMRLFDDLYVNVKAGEYHSLVLDLSKLLRAVLGDSYTWDGQLVKYGSFMANVAKAENSDQVQAAIESIALPVGSASIKRKSNTNIALNAFVGLAPGREYLNATDEWKTTFGLSSPVGVAFSWGNYKKKTTCDCYDEKGSMSIFLSLVDIGAFSTFRFNDNETEELPDVSFSNIFSPGLYLVKGLPNIPVSVGVGGQLGPQLRKIEATKVSTTDGLNASFKLFLAVDIPLINFYTKSRD